MTNRYNKNRAWRQTKLSCSLQNCIGQTFEVKDGLWVIHFICAVDILRQITVLCLWKIGLSRESSHKVETIFMKCRPLFLGTLRKIPTTCCLLMLSLRWHSYCIILDEQRRRWLFLPEKQTHLGLRRTDNIGNYSVFQSRHQYCLSRHEKPCLQGIMQTPNAQISLCIRADYGHCCLFTQLLDTVQYTGVALIMHITQVRNMRKKNINNEGT